jgi:TetR/AcrR family transcriptional regulator, transcriptional repressor for nem operon
MGRVSDAKPRLLQAAMDLIWKRSYGAVTVDDICEAAGVKKGSFYYFFKSKDELVAAAMDSKWEEIRPAYDRIFSASRPALDRLKDAFAYAYEKQKELRDEHGCALGCPFSSVGTELIAADKTLRDAVQRMIKAKQKYYESAIRDLQSEGLLQPGQDPAVLAKQAYSYFEGVLAQARISDDLEMLRGVYDGVLKLLGIRQTVSAS